MLLLKAYCGRCFYAYSIYYVIDGFEIEYSHQQYKLQAETEASASQNINMNMNHLEILLNCRFWFISSWVGPESLHF